MCCTYPELNVGGWGWKCCRISLARCQTHQKRGQASPRFQKATVSCIAAPLHNSCRGSAPPHLPPTADRTLDGRLRHFAWLSVRAGGVDACTSLPAASASGWVALWRCAGPVPRHIIGRREIPNPLPLP